MIIRKIIYYIFMMVYFQTLGLKQIYEYIPILYLVILRNFLWIE